MLKPESCLISYDLRFWGCDEQLKVDQVRSTKLGHLDR